MNITRLSPTKYRVKGKWDEDSPLIDAILSVFGNASLPAPWEMDGGYMDVTLHIKDSVAFVSFSPFAELPMFLWHGEATVLSTPLVGESGWGFPGTEKWSRETWEAWFDDNFSEGSMTFEWGSDLSMAAIANPVPKHEVYGLMDYLPRRGTLVVIPADVVLAA